MSFIFVCSVLLSIKLTARRDIKSFFNGTFTRIVASFQHSAWRQRIPSIRISFEHSKNLQVESTIIKLFLRLRKSWPPLSVETTVHFSSPTPSTRAFHAHRSYSAPLRRDEIFKKTPINFDRVLVSRQKVEKKNEEIRPSFCPSLFLAPVVVVYFFYSSLDFSSGLERSVKGRNGEDSTATLRILLAVDTVITDISAFTFNGLPLVRLESTSQPDESIDTVETGRGKIKSDPKIPLKLYGREKR